MPGINTASDCVFQAALRGRGLLLRMPHVAWSVCRHVLRYDTRCYFNVRSKADMSHLMSLPIGNDN